MRNMIIYSLIGVIFLGLAAILFFLLAPAKVLYSSDEISSECERIRYNGNPEEKIDIVFMTKNYESKNVDDYVNYLLDTEPFSDPKNKNKFNFFYSSYKPECEIYEKSALLCYSRKLIKNSAVCPNDYVVVLFNPSKKNKNLRSSAYMNVVSLNTNLEKSVFPHEFGHVFSNLADEYVPAKLPDGAKNCVKDCGSFGDTGGCYEGCSKSEYYRASKNSVMRSLSVSEYKEFDEKLVSKELEKYSSVSTDSGGSSQKKGDVTGSVTSEENNGKNNKYCEGKYVLLELNYSNGEFKLLEKSLVKGCPSKANYINSTEYDYRLKEDNESVYNSSINPSLVFIDGQKKNPSKKDKIDREISGGVLEKTSGKIYVSVPAEKADSLSIYKEDKKMFETKTYDVGATSCRVS